MAEYEAAWYDPLFRGEGYEYRFVIAERILSCLDCQRLFTRIMAIKGLRVHNNFL